MKKILFYIGHLGNGGAERVMSELANEFVGNNYDVTIVTDYRCEKEYKTDYNVKRHVVKYSKYKLVRNMSRIACLIGYVRKNKPDIIISFLKHNNYRAIISGIITNTPVVTSIRNNPSTEYPYMLSKLLSNVMYLLADGCVFQTSDAKNFFNNRVRKKSIVISNPINKSFFANIPSNKRNNCIVTVGRLEKQKNHKLLIKAFSIISDEFIDINVHIYGQGVMRSTLQNYIDELGLDKRVILKGYCGNLEHELYNSRMFVLSSDYEGMPNVLLEAMALGIPVISTDCPCGGSKKLIKDGLNGLLVPVDDVTALSRAMKKLLLDKQSGKRMGIESIKIANNFRTDLICRKWNEYINKIAND